LNGQYEIQILNGWTLKLFLGINKIYLSKISIQNFKNVLALKIHGLKHVAAVYYSNPLPPKKPRRFKEKKKC